MIFFLINYIVTCSISFVTSIKRKSLPYAWLFIFSSLFVFAASRTGYVDRDYQVYSQKFSQIISSNVEYFSLERIIFYEPAFYVIPKFSYYIFGPFYLYASFAIFAFIGIFLKLKAFKLSNSFFLATVIYVSYYFHLHEMTQIRAGIAAGLFLLSIKYIYNRNLIKFLLYNFFGILFHYSAIVYVPIFFFNPFKINKRLWSALMFVVLLASILHISVFNVGFFSKIFPKLDLYQKADKAKVMVFTVNVWNFMSLLNVFISFVLLNSIEKIQAYNKYAIIMLKTYLIGIYAYFILSSFPVLAGRVSELFLVVQICLFPCFIYLFKERLAGYLVTLIVALIYYWYFMYRTKLFVGYSVWWL